MVKGLLPTPVRQGWPCGVWVGGEALEGNGVLLRLLFCRSLSVRDAHTEPRVLIAASAPTLIYGGRGMDGRSYISYRVGMACFRARHTLRRA